MSGNDLGYRLIVVDVRVVERAGPPPSPVGYPRFYKLDVSLDGAAWQTVTQARGTGANTVIVFPPAQARFVRITQIATDEKAPPWSIQALKLYETAKAGGK